MERYGGCTDCFVPQEWCNRWEARVDEAGKELGGWKARGNGAEKCKFMDLILGGLAINHIKAGYTKGLRARMQAQGLDLERDDELLRYFGQKVTWGGLKTWVILKEFWL
ncbi:hypothetical protein MMC17_010276, partial [Xylographa soralifera]|nr:hypothetical protein [Xylographa soralifera]